MSWELRTIGPQDLRRYASVPMTLQVEAVLTPIPVRDGLGGLRLVLEAVAQPYTKDYDAQLSPLAWPARFDLPTWHLLAAVEGDAVLGGAAAFLRSATVAELWDIRVRPERRRAGIGQALLRAQCAWAQAQGARWLKAETQNVNVAACRFYQQAGGQLGTINCFAYTGQAAVEHETELDWFIPLAAP